MSLDCSVFVYKRILCSHGDLIVGDNSYQIIYAPKSSQKCTAATNEANVLNSPSSRSDSASSASGFISSFLGNLSPMLTSQHTDTLHRVVIDWSSIVGLQRINKPIAYNCKQKHTRRIQLREQLIIETRSYPQLYITHYNAALKKYETTSSQTLRTHYIGLEYDVLHSHQVLLSNNAYKIHEYNLLDTRLHHLHLDRHNIGRADDDGDSDADADADEGHLSLLEKYPAYSLLIDHGLPAWIWIPLLNHTLRVLIERVILLGNITLFIWTIYQMTKYTSIIKSFYQYIFRPVFHYISQPILKQIYYFLNLMKMNLVVQICSNIFNLFYNYIPIATLHSIIAFFDEHVIQQSINLVTMFYRLFVNIASLFVPLFNCMMAALQTCFDCVTPNLHCEICTRLGTLCCDGKCLHALQFMWQCLRRCCRLCQRSQTLTDSTQILKVGVRALNTETNMDGNTGSSVYTAFVFVWNYCKQIIDVFWMGIGKPIKHSYDFFRYIRSEVGVHLAICITKCCRKSKEKVKSAGKSLLKEARLKMKSREKEKEKEKESDSELSEMSETSDDQMVYEQMQRAKAATHGREELRYRAAKHRTAATHGTRSRRNRSKSEEFSLYHAKKEDALNGEEEEEETFLAVSGLLYNRKRKA